MRNPVRSLRGVSAGILLCLAAVAPVPAQTPAAAPADHRREAVVTIRATGTFDVKLVPQPSAEGIDDGGLGRMSIDKQFHGDLAGSSRGTMLAAGTAVKGSAGYVAMERVTGTLHGRKGTFVLQHSGTMTRGSAHLVLTVVPDSGTDQLTGLSGSMMIRIENGKHFYDLDYAIAPSL